MDKEKLICHKCGNDHYKKLDYWCDTSELEIKHHNLNQELSKLRAQLDEANEVISYYADMESYDRDGFPHGLCIKFGELYDDYSKATKDPKDLRQYGGKRARAYQAKYSQKLEGDTND